MYDPRSLPPLSMSDEQHDFIINLHAHIAQIGRDAHRDQVFPDAFTQQHAIIATAMLHAFGCMESVDDKEEVLSIIEAATDYAWSLYQRRVLAN